MLKKRLKRALIAKLFIICGLIGSNSACKQNLKAETAPRPDDSAVTEIIKPDYSDDTPRAIKVKLTLKNPAELRVKNNQELKAGDIIADRSEERSRIKAKINRLRESVESLNLSIERLQTTKTPELAPGANLPEDFTEIESSITQKKLDLANIEKTIEKQKAKISSLENLNLEKKEIILQHENVKLSELELLKAKAIGEITVAGGKLKTAQRKAEIEQSKRLAELNTQKVNQENQRQNLAIQTAQLEANKNSLETQIVEAENELGKSQSVKIPFDAVVRKINWEGQNNDEISVIITLDIVGQ